MEPKEIFIHNCQHGDTPLLKYEGKNQNQDRVFDFSLYVGIKKLERD
jgi:hypothetical protein